METSQLEPKKTSGISTVHLLFSAFAAIFSHLIGFYIGVAFFSVLILLFGLYKFAKTKDSRIAMRETSLFFATYLVFLASIGILYYLFGFFSLLAFSLLFFLFLGLHQVVKSKEIGIGKLDVAVFSMFYLVFLGVSVIMQVGANFQCNSVLPILILLGCPIASSLFIYRYFSSRGMPRTRVVSLAVANFALVILLLLTSSALVSVGPCLSSDARIIQSNSYWRGEPNPFRILEHSAGTDGNGVVVLQNFDESGNITLLNLSVGLGYNDTPATFEPGRMRIIQVVGVAKGTLNQGSVYELPVIITYKTADGKIGKEYGAKDLVGKYT